MPTIARPLGLIIAAVVLVACGSSGPPATPSSAAEPAASAGGVDAFEPLSGKVKDKKGDLVNPDTDAKVKGPAYIDVTRVAGDTSATDLTLMANLANAPPAKRSNTIEALSYTYALETTGDEDWDYWISLENLEDGSWAPSLTHWPGGDTLAGDVFPGRLAFADDVYAARVTLESIGNPDTIRVCLLTQRSTPELTVTAEDNAPGPSCLGDPTWLELR